jgi:hypothetical protein
MRLKLIACNVVQREACWCLAQSPHVVDAEFVELGEHARSDNLRQVIQAKIDLADGSGKAYDAILLLFGLCGNASVGLHARRTRLVMPRAHDCCTILLGSKARFAELFQDAPSTPFGSAGYQERGDYFLRVDGGQVTVQCGDAYAAYVAKYGEKKARFIWEKLHPAPAAGASNKALFIDMPQTAHLGHARRFREQAEAAGKEPVIVAGDIRLIRNLIFGAWDAEDFLLVEPGQRIEGVYDWSEIVRARDA